MTKAPDAGERPLPPARPTLARLLSAPRPDAAVVAWRSRRGGGERAVHWPELERQVEALRVRVARLPPGRVALYTSDSYAFAVGLLACWHAGRVAVSPPNAQPGALAALSEVVIGAVSDGDAPVPGRPLVPALAPREEPPRATGPWPALAPDAVVLELFTSGTTGRGKAVSKTLAHLEREVQGLEACFGARLGDAPVFGSASHQHLYGMLFRVLWPLAAGRTFHAQTLLHAEELLARVAARAPCAFASVPAHLKRLAEREGLLEIGARCRVVFSSGGPLAPDTAGRWEEAAGRAPVEIFGSTETGGVAWREQGRRAAGEEPEAPWTPFAGVAADREPGGERLRVRSPYVSVGDARAGFVMGDRVRLCSDGRFVTLGRADRVLKIGEKRLSLPDMEARLLEHAWVEGAVLLPVEHAGEQRLAAAVVLSAPGRAALEAEGRRAVGRTLGGWLARDWDRVLLPRAWRFPDALPEDAQGKRPHASLLALFQGGPEVLAEDVRSDGEAP